MHIHFFEEYPTDEQLSLAQHIEHPCTVFLAAPNPLVFAEAAARLKRWNAALTPAYWPLLPRSYWVSPFAFTQELTHLRDELALLRGERALLPNTPPLGVLLDLELPLLHRELFWKNATAFRSNKGLIESIFRDAEAPGVSLYTAEYPTPYAWTERIQRQLGVSYPSEHFTHTRIAMFYTSLAPKRRWAEWLGHRMLMRRSTQPHPERFFVGLGTIATGVFGNEPILSPEALAADLALLQEYGVEDVVIFRLGGLTEDYLPIIRSFSEA